MAVRRIVPNIAADNIEAAGSFYGGLLDLEIVMDHGWIVTYAGETTSAPQLSIAREGGSGAPVPDISIEVDNLDEVLERARMAGFRVEYGPAIEPWGVRRFFLRDPFGRLVNILSHI